MNNKIDQQKFKLYIYFDEFMEEHIDGQTFNVCYLTSIWILNTKVSFFMPMRPFIEMYLENLNTFLLIK